MTCLRVPNGIICVNPWGRLKVGNRYVWVDFHPYCGPSFYWDRDMAKTYEPADENDMIWVEFEIWLKKYNAKKEKQNEQRKNQGLKS
jgi:hypothetical protein